MPHSEPKIQCSNPNCLVSNKFEAQFCDRCSTPMVKRYLWSSQKAVTSEPEQTPIAERYFALSDRIFLDTQPHQPPPTPEEVSAEIVLYLQLFSCYPHIPQAYGLLDGNTWLFDYGTVPVDAEGRLIYPKQLLPKIEDLWAEATSLQQLNWLWQIAKLWKPLSRKKAAASLLDPEWLRINGQIVQLLQLQPVKEPQPSLRDLGELWWRWGKNAKPEIKDVVAKLAERLKTGEIARSSQAIAVLDRAINYCRQAYEYSYQTYALSDSGPSRSNNEDAAYPIQADANISSSENALAIVCDGVGGHEGGEIASGETIEYLRSKISQLALAEPNCSSATILSKLATYINGANDIISKRNDSELRLERQRMGTTLVMTLSHVQDMYLAHVGDSRIYWITPNSCHQVTTDDDLASREVRLGYALYQDALQYPSAGALIQALGMRNSAALHPNLQRYTIDGDCIFLLCTDGLSDFDRVEQQWRHSILPVLEGKQDLASAVKDLIALANEKNGHDNVTVALVHCQIEPSSNTSNRAISWADVESVLEESSLWSDANLVDSVWQDPSFTEPDTATATPVSTPTPEAETIAQPIGEALPAKRQPKWLNSLIWFLAISTAIGLGAYILLQNYFEPDSDREPTPIDTELEVEQ